MNSNGTAMIRNFILLMTAVVSMAQNSHAQVAITLAVNGYFGSNLLSSGNNLPDGTIVKLGMFYSSSAFTPTADVASNWAALSGTMQSRLSTFDDTFYTLASTTTSSIAGNGAEFQMLWTTDPSIQPITAYQKLFPLNPAVTDPTLSSINLALYNPYVWVETADRSEFGLFRAITAFPTGNFPDNDYSFDVMGTQATALVGTLFSDDSGFKLSNVPEPSVASLLLAGCMFAVCLKARKLSSENS
jgi:hypothetical protein